MENCLFHRREDTTGRAWMTPSAKAESIRATQFREIEKYYAAASLVSVRVACSPNAGLVPIDEAEIANHT
jgi:hypothetical protein